MQEYVDEFIAIIENLSAYTTNPDYLFYTTRFVDGLRDDIRSIVLIQRPQTLDASCTLALLQEEAAEPGGRKEAKKPETYSYFKSTTTKGAPTLTLPPPRQAAMPGAADRKPVEDKRPAAKPPMDEQLQSLRSYRRARGLCVRCAEKWQPGHCCAPVLQLHALQEVWNLCQDEFDYAADDETPVNDAPAQLFLMLSAAASTAHSSARSLQLRGTIGDQQIVIMVDSGSTHSFLNTVVAKHLPGLQSLAKPVSVQVANGLQISCDSEIPMAEWSIQQYCFHSTLKVLDIGTYDMIIGMDWLQAFSPMKIDWQQKWLQIPYGSSSIVLHGIHPEETSCSLVQLYHIASDPAAVPTKSHAPQLQYLLDEFAQLFAEPTELPPRRHCDHTIPLVPGAQPISMRPYRYAPALKSEIEKQVSEMLQSRFISPSTSSFSSPVLLVRKKDGSWRFCIDYRMLNALTMKSKFPIPVIDELLDELSSAAWFTTLDLRAGFNQIRLAPGEEYKTAFQTH